MAYRFWEDAVIDRVGEQGWTAPVAAPPIVPWLSREPDELSDEQRFPPRHTGCVEIDCIRHLVPPAIAAIAEQRAAEADVGADRVLIAWGVVSEETYVAALASSLGIPFEPLSHTSRRQCPLNDNQLIEAANTGMLPLSARDDTWIVVVPRLVDSRRLVSLAMSGSDMARRIRVTSTARLRDFVGRYTVRDIRRRAVDELQLQHPELSAAGGRKPLAMMTAVTVACAASAVLAPDVSLLAVEVVFGLVFLAWTGLRLVGLLSERFVRRPPRIFTDDWLPVYTIAIALYREAAAVPGLVRALQALNYPGIMAQTPQAFRLWRPQLTVLGG